MKAAAFEAAALGLSAAFPLAAAPETRAMVGALLEVRPHTWEHILKPGMLPEIMVEARIPKPTGVTPTGGIIRLKKLFIHK